MQRHVLYLGSTIEEFTKAASLLTLHSEVIAIEINASCPIWRTEENYFHIQSKRVQVIEAVNFLDKPIWAKLSPNTPELPDITEAATRQVPRLL